MNQGHYSVGRLLLIGIALLTLAVSCAAPPPPPPPPPIPSVVVTEDGITFYVNRLKLPGTRQEFRVREGQGNIWIPLRIIQNVRFEGPEVDRFRPAVITFNTGEVTRGEMFVDLLIEGRTDVGYWNIRLSAVRRLDLGTLGVR